MESGTGNGEGERAVTPFEQGDAQAILERLDLARQRRLREEQLLRREREREPSARGLEAAEEVQRRETAQCPMHS